MLKESLLRYFYRRRFDEPLHPYQFVTRMSMYEKNVLGMVNEKKEVKMDIL